MNVDWLQNDLQGRDNSLHVHPTVCEKTGDAKKTTPSALYETGQDMQMASGV